MGQSFSEGYPESQSYGIAGYGISRNPSLGTYHMYRKPFWPSKEPPEPEPKDPKPESKWTKFWKAGTDEQQEGLWGWLYNSVIDGVPERLMIELPFNKVLHHFPPHLQPLLSPAQNASGYEWTTAAQALESLRARPLDVQGNEQLVNELKLFLEWQADLDYMRDPPPGSDFKPYDLLGELDIIEVKLSSNDTYESEYDAQMAIEKAFTQAHDEHLAYFSEMRRHAQFVRDRDTALVLIAENSSSAPKLFLFNDIVQEARRDIRSDGPKNSTVSDVTLINNVDATTYLRQLAAEWSKASDDDGGVDELLTHPNGNGGMDIGNFAFPPAYVGANTTIGFSNGTERVYVNYGRVEVEEPRKEDWEDTMDQMYEAPISRFAAYLLDGQDKGGVAVMQIPSFRFDRRHDLQQGARDFLQQCRTTGQKKLLIDLRGNSGGDVMLPEDLIQQLFPSGKTLQKVMRFSSRDHPAYRKMGSAVTNLLQHIATSDRSKIRYGNLESLLNASWKVNTTNLDLNAADIRDEPHPVCVYGELLSMGQLNDNGTEFQSLQEIIGPARTDGKPRTQAAHENFDNPAYFGPGSCSNFTLSGHGRFAAEAHLSQPFATEDMLAVVGGDCSSACAVFVEALIAQGVKVLRVGGLPNTDPIRAVAGTTGGRMLTFADIVARAALLQGVTPLDEWNGSALQKLAEAKSWAGKGMGSVSGQNILSFADESDIPLRMAPKRADARLFYTKETLMDDRAFWKDVVDAWWGGKGVVGRK